MPCSVFASEDAVGTMPSTVRCADFFNMSADMFFGENWHLCIDRKCVRLNPRDQREVSAKGCKQTARKREDRGDIERTVAPVAPLK